jgi:hypothetical protein
LKLKAYVTVALALLSWQALESKRHCKAIFTHLKMPLSIKPALAELQELNVR